MVRQSPEVPFPVQSEREETRVLSAHVGGENETSYCSSSTEPKTVGFVVCRDRRSSYELNFLPHENLVRRLTATHLLKGSVMKAVLKMTVYLGSP